MNTNINDKEEKGYSTYFYIHLFFVFIGLITYLMFLFLLFLCIKDISLLKNELLSFIILNSLKSFLEIVLSSSFIKEIIIYAFEIIEFYLILSFINKSICSKKISSNSSYYELEYLYYIVFIYSLCFFPYDKIFNLKGKMIFTHNTIKISLIVLLFRYIQIKMEILLDYLAEKKAIVTSRPDIYMPYKKAQYYYTNFTIVNILYYIVLVLSISYYILKILILFFIKWNKIIKYLMLIFEESLYCTLVVSCLIFFYTLNRSKIRKRRKKKDKSKVEENTQKYSESDADNLHDENAQLAQNNEDKKENYLEKDEENIDEEEKVKSSSKGNNEEDETLK
jgi:hypothetical protein